MIEAINNLNSKDKLVSTIINGAPNMSGAKASIFVLMHLLHTLAI